MAGKAPAQNRDSEGWPKSGVRGIGENTSLPCWGQQKSSQNPGLEPWGHQQRAEDRAGRTPARTEYGTSRLKARTVAVTDIHLDHQSAFIQRVLVSGCQREVVRRGSIKLFHQVFGVNI